MNDAIGQFKAAMQAAGLEPPDVIEAGKLHRFPTNGKRGDDAGWCRLFPDMRGGVFGDHRSGLSEHWQAKTDRAMTAGEYEAFKRMVAESKRQAEANETKRHEAAALNAVAILEAATGDPATHAYAIKKRVPFGDLVKRGPWPQRGWLDALLVPIYSADGCVWSIEAINGDGDKDSLKDGKKRGGFCPIGKVRGAARVHIAEGIANAAVCAEVDKSPAVAAMGKSNLLHVALAVRELVPDAELIILADNDLKLPKEANEAAAAIGGRVVVPELDGRKCDLWDVWHECGADAIKNVLANATSATAGTQSEKCVWPEPKPLQRPLDPPAAFPLHALGNVLEPAARELADAIQAPTAIISSSLLAASALASQGFADVGIDGRRYPISCYFMTLGASGERKSSVDRAVLWPHTTRQKELFDIYSDEIKQFRISEAAYEQKRKEVLSGGKKKSRALVERELTDLGPPPTPLTEPLMLVSEPTYEGLVKMLARSTPSVGIFSDEGGQFIGGYGMSKDNALKTAAGLSNLWDGRPVDRVRSGDGATLLYGRRLSCHLMAQPGIASEMLGSKMLLEQGLLSRFLVAFPESTAGTRFYRSVDLSTLPGLRAYSARMLALLKSPLPINERSDLEPRVLELAPDAKSYWARFHDAVESELQGELAPIRGFASKAPEHALRLAAVLTTVEQASVVALDAIERGIAIAEFYLSEALRLFDAGQEDLELALAQKLYDWMLARGKHTVTLVEIYKDGGIAQLRSASKARKVMAILQTHGLAMPLKEGAEYDGVPRREAWRVRHEI